MGAGRAGHLVFLLTALGIWRVTVASRYQGELGQKPLVNGLLLPAAACCLLRAACCCLLLAASQLPAAAPGCWQLLAASVLCAPVSSEESDGCGLEYAFGSDDSASGDSAGNDVADHSAVLQDFV